MIVLHQLQIPTQKEKSMAPAEDPFKRAREEDEKWGRSEGRLREIVDQDVRGRDEGGGKERGRWRSGGFVSFNLGRFCSYVLSMMSSVQTNIEKQTVHA